MMARRILTISSNKIVQRHFTSCVSIDKFKWDTMIMKSREDEINFRRAMSVLCIEYFNIQNCQEMTGNVDNNVMELIEKYKKYRIEDIDLALKEKREELETTNINIESISLDIEFLEANKKYLLLCKTRDDYLANEDYFHHFWYRSLSMY